MNKKILAALTVPVMLLGVTGCGQNNESDNVTLTMYLLDKSMTKELTPWLEQQFPEIDFTFVVGYNTMEFYTDLDARGALPDIITCRRFSLMTL